MKIIDQWFERSSRAIARKTSRRHVMAQLGVFLVGAAGFPLLPVARGGNTQERPQPQPAPDPDSNSPEGDPFDCNYWRYCAIDGYLCGCCGGSANSCPPGTTTSPLTWIGTCRNPVDGVNYLVSYNDCCGKSTCNRCFCSRSDGEKPVYYPPKSGHINWCVGTGSSVYHCSTANIIGRAV